LPYGSNIAGMYYTPGPVEIPRPAVLDESGTADRPTCCEVIQIVQSQE
jgi:hypothetical protein